MESDKTNEKTDQWHNTASVRNQREREWMVVANLHIVIQHLLDLWNNTWLTVLSAFVASKQILKYECHDVLDVNVPA